jgi:hypothetical protein
MAVSGALPIEFWDPSCGTYNELGSETSVSEDGASGSIENYSSGTYHRCFCQPFNCTDEILLQVTSSVALTLRVVDAEGDLLYTTPFSSSYTNGYVVSFIPNDHDICDMQIKLQITRTSTGAILYKSDCLDIKPNHKESVLITYTNSASRNFAGINYADVSPDPEFQIRIPASFFHQRFPKEQEVMELSNSQSLQLNAELKVQKHLEVGPMPYYMHNKLLLILMHDFVTINGVQYVKEESYELLDSTRRNPMRQAKVWLTQKDYIVRNIL